VSDAHIPNEDVSAFPSRGGMLLYVDAAHRDQLEEALKQINAFHSGLTKRELFAAMAMQGYCSQSVEHDWTLEEVATDAVAQADALLAALRESQP
jgi:hypothetical protein